MSIRNHRLGNRVPKRRMPTDIDLGTKIHKDTIDDGETIENCIYCDQPNSSVDMENGICYDCLENICPKCGSEMQNSLCENCEKHEVEDENKEI